MPKTYAQPTINGKIKWSPDGGTTWDFIPASRNIGEIGSFTKADTDISNNDSDGDSEQVPSRRTYESFTFEYVVLDPAKDAPNAQLQADFEADVEPQDAVISLWVRKSDVVSTGTQVDAYCEISYGRDQDGVLVNTVTVKPCKGVTRNVAEPVTAP